MLPLTYDCPCRHRGQGYHSGYIHCPPCRMRKPLQISLIYLEYFIFVFFENLQTGIYSPPPWRVRKETNLYICKFPNLEGPFSIHLFQKWSGPLRNLSIYIEIICICIRVSCDSSIIGTKNFNQFSDTKIWIESTKFEEQKPAH